MLLYRNFCRELLGMYGGNLNKSVHISHATFKMHLAHRGHVSQDDMLRAYQEMKLFGFIKADQRGVEIMPTLL